MYGQVLIFNPTGSPKVFSNRKKRVYHFLFSLIILNCITKDQKYRIALPGDFGFDVFHPSPQLLVLKSSPVCCLDCITVFTVD
jgi:hypothetical protein